MDTIRTEITGESREVDILAGDREIQIREEALEVIEETVAASEEADFVADESADEADFDADETADEAMPRMKLCLSRNLQKRKPRLSRP